MGAQSVGSQGGGVSTVQMHKSESLARQGSLYSLTLDEVQTQLGDLGKPLSSMNLDELLKTVWTAEATQAPDNNNNVISGSASGLHKQGSLTLLRDLSKKTVDEVWKDIQHKNNEYSDQERNKVQEKNPTLGEITLEDFLVKAGVVTESYNNNNNNNNNSEKGNAAAGVLGVDSIAAPQHSHWMQMQFQLPSVQQQQQNMMVLMHHPVPVPVQVQQQPLPVMDAPFSDTHMTMSPTSLIGTLSDTQTPGRKRGATGEVVEKTVERRQKRMIKNRESAARSRARKQAYTHELENKVSRLEEENERLRRQKEEEKVLPSAPPPEPKYQLRRTSSAPI
nr:ABSCISIC ACID-INSENSITIVE 5-like protein 2 [Quercus suber]